ncbi:hypothetical protein ABZ883_02945 [Streptomyces sp. NPDC046977]|uniref:hypothetical protein n=1 Tax=Streptomyces sp. NPDC046977 TaxID=3154703 RepID=UPI0033D01D71
MEEAVEPVFFGFIQEAAQLCRGPDHDGARFLTGLFPALDALFGPEQRLGAFAGVQFHMLGGVEGDELPGDGRVQRGPQSGTDALPRSGASGLAERRHLRQLGPLGLKALALTTGRGPRLSGPASGHLFVARCVLGRDHFVFIADALEHLLHVTDVQAVQPEMPDAGPQMHLHVAAVAVCRGRARLLRCEPGIQPFAHGHFRPEVDAAAQLALGLVHVGDRQLLRRNLLQQFGNALVALGVALVGDG